MMDSKEQVVQHIETVRVLIADDDPPTRILLRAAITQWGYHVIEASDGEEAWNILKAPDAPQLLIVDWLMPTLDGIGLCERIRKNLSYHPYIILLTQVAGTANIIIGLEAGADEFLSKPFNMAELRSRLSVGSRIIRYQLELAEHNKKIKENVTGLDVLSKALEELSKKINLIFSNPTVENASSSEINQELEQINNLIQKIKLNL